MEYSLPALHNSQQAWAIFTAEHPGRLTEWAERREASLPWLTPAGGSWVGLSLQRLHLCFYKSTCGSPTSEPCPSVGTLPFKSSPLAAATPSMASSLPTFMEGSCPSRYLPAHCWVLRLAEVTSLLQMKGPLIYFLPYSSSPVVPVTRIMFLLFFAY